jgi:hypothetical protein
MFTKPLIVHIEGNDSNYRNMLREALRFYLKHDCDCNVLAYDNEAEFNNDLVNIKRSIMQNQVLLVIVKQDEYTDEHLRVINTIHDISATVPIVVLPVFCDKKFNGIPENKMVYALDHTNKKLVSLIQNLILDYKPLFNWFGAYTKDEQALLLNHLERAYKNNYLGEQEKNNIAIPDSQNQIIAESIRLKLLPTELIKEEFDACLSKTVFLEKKQDKIYLKEIKRIKRMTKSKRQVFAEMIMRAIGYIRCGSGWLKLGVSLGDNNMGFAIDPITLATFTAQGFGSHKIAKINLAYQVLYITELRTGEYVSEHEIKNRLVWGIIIPEVKGFKTPVLSLSRSQAEQQDLKKVARHLLNERKVIPVDEDGYLIEG